MQKFTLCKDRLLYGLFVLLAAAYGAQWAVSRFLTQALEEENRIDIMIVLIVLAAVTRYMFRRVQIQDNRLYGIRNSSVHLMKVIDVRIVNHEILFYDSNKEKAYIPLNSSIKIKGSYYRLLHALRRSIPWENVRVDNDVYHLLHAEEGESVDVTYKRGSVFRGGLMGLIVFFSYYLLVQGIAMIDMGQGTPLLNILTVVTALTLGLVFLMFWAKLSTTPGMMQIAAVLITLVVIIGGIQQRIVSQPVLHAADWMDFSAAFAIDGITMVIVLVYIRTSRRVGNYFRKQGESKPLEVIYNVEPPEMEDE